MQYFYVLPTLLLSTLISASPAQPGSLHARAPSIPAVPADPPKPAGDGAGVYNSESPGIGDYASKAKFFTIAAAAGEIGMLNAERGMRHYLDNTGADLDIQPEIIMNGLANFRTGVQALAQNEAKAAHARASKAADGTATFASAWKNYGYATGNFNKDWYYAIGSFSYAVTGVVTVNKGQASLQYIAHIFDRYNWDTGKSVTIGPFTIEDKELGNLHRKGLAKEYIVRGHSQVQKVDKYDPNVTLPLPGGGGTRPAV